MQETFNIYVYILSLTFFIKGVINFKPINLAKATLCLCLYLSIREDFSDIVNKKRSDLRPKLIEARNMGKTASLCYDKLIVHDWPFMKFGDQANAH